MKTVRISVPSIKKKVFDECRGSHPDCLPKALQRYQGDGETGLTLKVKEKTRSITWALR